MNICFFADGRAEHTRRWTKYFAQQGHQVDLITLNPDILEGYEPVRVHLIRKPLKSSSITGLAFNFPYVLKSIRDILTRISPDILHAHSAGGYAWLAMASGFHPYVITPWGNDVLIDAQASWLIRILSTKALQKADLVTCDGYNTIATIKSFGVDQRNIALITFGVDINRFSANCDKSCLVRQKLDLGDDYVIISTRTLSPVHDVETFIRSIPGVLDKVPNSRFIIVGDGPDRNYLESLADSFGVNNKIIFVGRVEEEEMINYLQVADVYVSTSTSDSGLAASTAEAMACQLPVVVTDNGDNKEWISEGVSGFIVPNKSIDLVTDRVIKLLKTDELRSNFGAVNRKVIEERNNYYLEMDKMEELYKLLSVPKRSVC